MYLGYQQAKHFKIHDVYHASDLFVFTFAAIMMIVKAHEMVGLFFVSFYAAHSHSACWNISPKKIEHVYST